MSELLEPNPKRRKLAEFNSDSSDSAEYLDIQLVPESEMSNLFSEFNKMVIEVKTEIAPRFNNKLDSVVNKNPVSIDKLYETLVEIKLLLLEIKSNREQINSDYSMSYIN